MPQDSTLEGRRALVTGGNTSFGGALLAGLRSAGAQAASLALPDASREGIHGAFDAAVAELGGLDAVVHASSDHDHLRARPLMETSEDAWQSTCETTLQRALFVMQAGFAHMRDHGGRIILVTPTLSTAGAAGLVPLAAGVEAIRVLGKVAAKQWGKHGITVNSLAPSLDALAEGRDVQRVSLGEPSLPGFDPLRHLGPIVSFLAGEASANLTGVTLPVDGGCWMPS
jgi:NAD(P)-dependent dehydrogenase (short-subunit alcohol dehydrogenase family)